MYYIDFQNSGGRGGGGIDPRAGPLGMKLKSLVSILFLVVDGPV